jgi:hypothetical protein
MFNFVNRFPTNYLCNNFSTNLGRISHNVPAVYDVFAVAIKETVGFQQPQKCVWSERGNEAQRNDLV